MEDVKSVGKYRVCTASSVSETAAPLPSDSGSSLLELPAGTLHTEIRDVRVVVISVLVADADNAELLTHQQSPSQERNRYFFISCISYTHLMIRREVIVGSLSTFTAIISGCTNRLFEEEETGYIIIINRTESPIDIQIEILGSGGQSLLDFDGELDYIGGEPELDEEISVTNGQTLSANVKFPDASEEYNHKVRATQINSQQRFQPFSARTTTCQ